jgi:hypothetical protein
MVGDNSVPDQTFMVKAASCRHNPYVPGKVGTDSQRSSLSRSLGLEFIFLPSTFIFTKVASHSCSSRDSFL